MSKKDFTVTDDGRIIRNSFVIYRSMYDTILMLQPEKGFQLMKIICGYGFDGIEPDYDEILTPIFTNIKPNIDANNKKALNGLKGGRGNKKDKERDDNFKKRKKTEDHATIEARRRQAQIIVDEETDKALKSV